MVKNFILSSKVFHKRHHPKQNSFRYRSYYVILDMLNLKQSKTKFFSINKPNLYSFYDKDHGLRDGSSSLKWATDLLNQYKLEYDDIKLMTMPRVLGYLFNPVSFWLCYKNNKLIAVIAEVNNTFKETHSYICHKNGQDITNKCWFKAEKIFHVSPFYRRQGFYKFNFALNFEDNAKNQIIINYYDNDQLQLGTAINGNMKSLSTTNLIKEFFRSPLLTFKVIYLIHWQALKIVLKKIKYIPKPIQHHDRITVAKFINV
ncbi:DUF1365 domain-containing protein [Francisella tularensis]|uniref:DUF1365 domain-containing protein n=1 Tax=Francisella tularensis TaxID=263 RepID=UPI0008F519D2|nr:DUF1365 domain-containing protein [Francisella tularensis]APA83632.1 Hypothetical protein N894_1648 [Francisella tularensis subsp. novicida PA10-7858]